MRKKIATVFVVSFCLILILFSFYGKSVTLDIRLIIAISAFAILVAIYYSIRNRGKTGEIKSINKTESQKIINDNIDLLDKRWERIEKEYNSGTLKTVSKWYFEDATYDQISRLKEMGINLSTELTPSDCTKNYRVLRLGRRLPEGEEKGPCHETQTLHSGFQKIDS